MKQNSSHFITLFLLVGIAISLQSCLKDDCKSTRRFIQYTPISRTTKDFRKDIRVAAARELKNPGKIYFYNDYILINEQHEGIHIIDNKNPANPRKVAFIEIPLNMDMAIKDNVLYADSFFDLLAIDFQNPESPKQLSRTNDVLGSFPLQDGVPYFIYNETKEVTLEINCNDTQWAGSGPWFNGGVLFDAVGASPAPSKTNTSSSTGGTGTGGSLARFTLYDDYLYTVDNFSLKVFNIKELAAPKLANTNNLGWGIETIYPYQDKLFIGSQSGMFIFDNSNPEAPKQLSTFQHARMCDPVVVEGNTAYVTLRDGTTCQGFNNELDVVDISSLTAPKLVKVYPLHNPHGLAIKKSTLFICDGSEGLKVFDAKDNLAIDKNLLDHKKGFATYDVIALPNKDILFVVGADGFYEFDSSNISNLKQISFIPVVKNQ